MKIGELMTPRVLTCCASDSLNEAARIMWEHDCGCVTVVDAGGKAIGMITDRDVCMAAYTQGLPLAQIPVSTAASHGVFAAQMGDDLSVAEAVMREHQVRRVPVVDREGKPIGIVTVNDLALNAGRGKPNSLSSDMVVHTLAAICRHQPGAEAE